MKFSLAVRDEWGVRVVGGLLNGNTPRNAH